MLHKKLDLYLDHYFYILICFSLFISACSTKTKIEIEGPLTLVGLKNVEVNQINVDYDNMLILSDDGAYIKEGVELEHFGLQGKPVIDIVQLTTGEYLAGIFTNELDNGDKTLYKKENGSWKVFMGNYGGEEGIYTKVTGLEKHPNKDIVYASGAVNVFKTSDSGNYWELLYRTWDSIGGTNFFEMQPNHSENIWIGGVNNIDNPTLHRTTDGGETWEFINTFELAYSENFDILFNETDQDHIIVGLGGAIRSSRDLGETWETVLLESYSFKTFAKSSSPGKIFASGTSRDNAFFMFLSYDYGLNWVKLDFEEAPENMEVNDMVAVQEEGREVLYLGTNRGLFSYIVESE
ncbi:MAG: hypothetical protein JJ892_13330 [Balneola sp.]|nr:hypothetical protein [Balneola sp.]MBO6649577.1 hypothetical protein [Balneola sp.]MBO6711394.1 hypothetical protein [Balneola sp.]MBO6801252.1 hypothetical protein [Balneola sp.]MBO6869330.1 hypothetical protein [Balneola sp.]